MGTIILAGLGLAFCVVGILIIHFEANWIWAPLYYQSGIPIYLAKAKLPFVTDISASFPYVKSQLPSNFIHTTLQFRKIGENLYAFRCNPFELRLLGLSYFKIMRRVIRFDPTSSEMEITGYLSWKYLFLSILIAFLHY